MPELSPLTRLPLTPHTSHLTPLTSHLSFARLSPLTLTHLSLTHLSPSPHTSDSQVRRSPVPTAPPPSTRPLENSHSPRKSLHAATAIYAASPRPGSPRTRSLSPRTSANSAGSAFSTRSSKVAGWDPYAAKARALLGGATAPQSLATADGGTTPMVAPTRADAAAAAF